MSGTVESLTTDWRGDTLAADVADTDDFLEVGDTADFDEDGGWLVVADSLPMEYTDVDEDAGMVFLAAPAGAAFDAGDPVVLWDPSVPPAGAKVVEYVASVMTDQGSVDVVVPHETIPLAGTEALIGASVPLVEDEGGEWYIGPPLGREPALDLAYADPDTIPSGQTFSADAPTETAGYPEGYGWWQVDDDDNVLGFWRLESGAWVASTVVTMEALKADNILTTALDGETITGATVQTRPDQDRGVKLGKVSGTVNYDEALIVFDDFGTPFLTAVPAEGMAVIAGKLTANSLTVNGGAAEGSSLGGVTEVTRALDGSAGAIRLTAGTTAPKGAPTPTTGYETVQFTDDGKWGSRYGWATDGTYWYTGRRTGSTSYLEKWNSSGVRVDTSGGFDGNVLGVTVDASAGRVYMFNAFGVKRAVEKMATSDLSYIGGAEWVHSDGSALATIGFDATTGDLLIAQSRSSNADQVRIRRYTFSQPILTAGAFVDSAFSYAEDLAGVIYGTHDLGANRYIFTGNANQQFKVIDSTGAAVAAEDWQAGMSAGKVGFVYTGGVFKSMDANGLMRTYTGQDKAVAIGSANLTKWVSNTLANATYETDQSPRAKIVMPKRSKLNVTTSAINTGGANAPDRVRIYVGQGATDPGNTNMIKQTDPAVGVTTTSYSSIATSPDTNPPPTNGFPDGTVQEIQLANGTKFLDGLGAGSAWTAYTPTLTAATTNPNLANFTRAGRYARLGRNTVKGSIVLTCTGTGGTGGVGTGAYEIGLPVAARALNEVVVKASQSGPNHMYIGRNDSSTSTFNLHLTSTDGVMNSTTSGMTTGTIVRIDFEYEAA